MNSIKPEFELIVINWASLPEREYVKESPSGSVATIEPILVWGSDTLNTDGEEISGFSGVSSTIMPTDCVSE